MEAADDSPVGRRQWNGLVVLITAISLLLINGTVVAVLMPVIIGDLDMTLTQAQWANAVFTLTFAALLLPAGWLGDRFGQRRVLVGGVLVFLAGTILVGTAATGTALIAARALQGIAGAAISPSALSVVNSTFRGKQRVVAFAIWGAALGGAAALGPLLGGWLADVWTWRAAFLLTVPITAILLLGIFRYLDADRVAADARSFDVLGSVLSILSMALLVFGLIQGYTYGWITPATEVTFLGITWSADAPISITPFILGAGALLGWLFIRHEQRMLRQGRAPLADLRLFRFASFRRGNTTLLLATLGQFGLFFTLPLYCQIVLGFDTLETGWALATVALGAMVSAAVAAPLAKRSGVRLLVIGGMALSGILMGVLALTLSTQSTFAMLAPQLFVYGVGVGLATAQLSGLTLAEVPITLSGQGSALQSAARQLGSALGTAVLGTVLAVTLAGQVDAALSEVEGVPPEAVSPLSDAVADSGGTAILTLQDPAVAAAFAGQPGADLLQPVIDASLEGYTAATSITLGVGAVIILLGAGSAMRLPRREGATVVSRSRQAAPTVEE